MQRLLKAVAAIMLMTAVFCAVGCNKTDDPNNGGNNESNDNEVVVTVTTTTSCEITSTTAKCGAEVIISEGVGLRELGVCWSTQPNPIASGNHLSTTIWNEPFVCTITNLESNTEYYVRAYALCNQEYYYGVDKSFVTEINGGGGIEPTPPSVVTMSLKDISQTSAVGCGSVIDEGNAPVFERGVCWSTFSNPTVNDNHASNGSGLGEYTIMISDLLPNHEYHVRAYAMNSAGAMGYGRDVSFTLLSSGEIIEGHEYVDLGLPSGILWATSNVGADTPEGYGNVVAWGETQAKSVYELYTYQFYNGAIITKYTNEDGFTILQPEDDAATTNWGGVARMPTKEEWQELRDCCKSWYNTSINGVSGLRLIGPNYNSIFLPTNRLIGSYWSSSLNTDVLLCAWSFHFDGYVGVSSECERYYGNFVRAVHEN